MTTVQLADMTTLQRVFCEAAGENEIPPLNLTKSLVVRTPHFWVLLFEEREVTRGSFVTEDGTDGILTTRFIEAVTRVFSTTVDPPHLLADEDKRDAAELGTLFRSVGALYAAVPIKTPPPIAGEDADTRATRLAKAKKDAAVNLLVVLEPLLTRSKAVLDTLNAAAIRRHGGSAERFRAAQVLVPADWPARDREALKRATTKAEVYLPEASDGARKRPRPRAPDPKAPPGQDLCRICGKAFPLGKWNAHRKKDCN